VTLRLPEGTNAQLEASTSNGSIQTDLPVVASGVLKKTELRGRLGEGGPLVKLSTSNSNVRILRE
jgi:hypothetical protein